MPVYRDDATNTGILTGTLYPLDIDIEDQAIVDEIVAMTEKLFGRTIVRCRQNSPRRLLPYRIENQDARKIIITLSCGKLEFLGAGNNSSASGNTRQASITSGKGSPSTRSRSMRSRSSTTPGSAPSPPGPRSAGRSPEKAKPNGDGRKRGKADFRNTCLKEDVEAALKALPCDYDRETWVKLGMAYRAGGGSYAVFLEWSRQHPQYRIRRLCPGAVAVLREQRIPSPRRRCSLKSSNAFPVGRNRASGERTTPVLPRTMIGTVSRATKRRRTALRGRGAPALSRASSGGALPVRGAGVADRASSRVSPRRSGASLA